MSTTIDFISELIRAAIRDLRDRYGVEQSALGREVVIYLRTASAYAKRLLADQTEAALLNAVDRIPTLKIVLNAKG